MAEVKRRVIPFEVNYVCDKCNRGMLKKCGDTDPVTGNTEHKCLICDHKQTFQWITYPWIDYVAEDDV